MECVINPRLPYTGFPGLVEKQREALDRHIRTLSKSHVVHPGIGSFGSGRVDVGSIPGESAPLQPHSMRAVTSQHVMCLAVAWRL